MDYWVAVKELTSSYHDGETYYLRYGHIMVSYSKGPHKLKLQTSLSQDWNYERLLWAITPGVLIHLFNVGNR